MRRLGIAAVGRYLLTFPRTAPLYLTGFLNRHLIGDL
jgi:hypothetical protein